MSFFKNCEDCDTEINSYEYIFCDVCLVKHLKCQDCNKQITKEQDYETGGNCLCKGCFIIQKIVYNDRSFESCFPTIKIRLEENFASKFQSLTDSELEAKWQSSANSIGMYAMKSWNCIPEEEEELYRAKAIEFQEIQSIVQTEITRRSRD